MNIHKFSTAAAALVLAFPLMASAQGAPGADRAEQASKRFDDADTDHDGKLTRAEAAKLPRVSKNFDAIDKDGHGYITKADIATWYKAQMAAKKGGSGG